SGIIATTDKLAAPGATRPIFSPYGRREVDVHHIRDRRQPGQHVGKFGRLLLRRALSQRSGQLANFFHQPHERAIDPPGTILFQVHLPNQRLEILKRNRSRSLSHSTRPSLPIRLPRCLLRQPALVYLNRSQATWAPPAARNDRTILNAEMPPTDPTNADFVT